MSAVGRAIGRRMRAMYRPKPMPRKTIQSRNEAAEARENRQEVAEAVIKKAVPPPGPGIARRETLGQTLRRTLIYEPLLRLTGTAMALMAMVFAVYLLALAINYKITQALQNLRDSAIELVQGIKDGTEQILDTSLETLSQTWELVIEEASEAYDYAKDMLNGKHWPVIRMKMSFTPPASLVGEHHITLSSQPQPSEQPLTITPEPEPQVPSPENITPETTTGANESTPYVYSGDIPDGISLRCTFSIPVDRLKEAFPGSAQAFDNRLNTFIDGFQIDHSLTRTIPSLPESALSQAKRQFETATRKHFRIPPATGIHITANCQQHDLPETGYR